MRLYWWDRGGRSTNFGDELNPWMWPRLLPGAFDVDDGTVFLGIGTILNRRVPAAERYVVLGAGTGYGELPRVDRRWRFLAVRGPLTAEALGLPPRAAVVDPAVLVPELVESPAPPRRRPAFMPHWRSAGPRWPRICEGAGMDAVDPLAPVDDVIAGIRGAAVLVTEAMHGAIVADAFGVPWVAVGTDNPDHLPFKWRDWCASLEMEHEAHPLPLPWRWGEPARMPGRVLQKLARIVLRPAREAAIARRLREIVEGAPRRLSDREVLAARAETLRERIGTLREELEAGDIP